ncbi:hypothetical protein AXG93_1217s1700 [Marchantia polymorpha subsp. ruderalis]|uniref:Uncharacterized protein n=1 Tax=Marchantia polymorpha subsp. ruderalis TaxID=1480154 RepID=A0A176VVQ7_MARPO|nr:hypothetical protein AXG93_1217s1700 [Marchantia polymorpha subsp. ruderalis]
MAANIQEEEGEEDGQNEEALGFWEEKRDEVEGWEALECTKDEGEGWEALDCKKDEGEEGEEWEEWEEVEDWKEELGEEAALENQEWCELPRPKVNMLL